MWHRGSPGLGAVVLAVLAALAVGWAPAPLPRRAVRTPPLALAGAWDVKWNGSAVRLDLRADGSARFAYVPGGGSWDGSWKYDGGMRVTLTLILGTKPTDYVMTFDTLGNTAAEGKCSQGGSTWPVKFRRAGQ